VIAVVRAGAAPEARTIVHGLARACVPAIELTMTVPGAVEIIAELAGSGLQTVLGAGTVLDPAEASACAAAGARFLVSPVTDADVLAEAHRCGVPYVGGALTPTEVLASMRAGADAVKLFPVGSMGGAGYLRALREPLPGLRAVVSGGIAAGEVGDYLAAGAHAVCLGGALIDREAARRGDVDAVAAWARAALGRISAALRSGPGRYGAALVASPVRVTKPVPRVPSVTCRSTTPGQARFRRAATGTM
jgi:2-dehydro-3-deoxyphosphogluconate aldolase/(4S)-4-hydroxy-2-oxoglutarate aldolase